MIVSSHGSVTQGRSMLDSSLVVGHLILSVVVWLCFAMDHPLSFFDSTNRIITNKNETSITNHFRIVKNSQGKTS